MADSSTDTLVGFLAGFFLACIGVLIVYLLTKNPSTRRGAWIGFAVSVIVSLLARSVM